MDVSHITDDSLFLKVPEEIPESPSTLEELYTDLLSTYDYDSIIDKTYHIIKQHGLGWDQVLQVWEIRLTLHLWCNQLARARKEGVNLNNGIYQASAAQAKDTKQERPAILQSSPSMTSIGSQNSARQQQPIPIFPLPKHLALPHSLTILLLRLKSLPNMNLVNEYYKLTYQLRLKSTVLELAPKLVNLSYDVIVILTLTKNYTTLINYIRSIRHELTVIDGDDYKQYRSNLSLMLIISELVADKYFARTSTETAEKYASVFDEINDVSRDSLRYVLRTIHPTTTSDTDSTEEPQDPLNGSDLTLTSLVLLVESGALSTRIVCSTLGLWDISTSNNKLHIQHDGLHIEGSDPPEDQLQKSLDIISHNWHKYIYKVYALE